MSKVTLWSRDGRLLDRQVRPNALVEEAGLRRLDVEGIGSWLVETLAAHAGKPVEYLIPVGHGAGVAGLRDGALAFAPLDYEQAIPDEVMADYRRQRDAFSLTGSPALPDGLNFAMSGIGSAQHLAGVEFALRAGIQWTYVPYKGGSAAIADVVAGHADVLFNGMLAVHPFMRSGQLKGDDWSAISRAMGRLGTAPIYIDDNPNLTIMEIRAKARRLKSQVGQLGMIVIDYLQLMTGRSSAENRQVEVSELSRGLKFLARELETPVVALSQLSRNLEMRADKRPMLADLRESGCLTADARVLCADTGAEVTMGELLLTGEELLDHPGRQ